MRHDLLDLPLLFLLPFVMLAGCAQSIRPEKLSPELEKSMKSLASTSSAHLEIVNDSRQTIKVYWLDFEGRRKLYRTLEAGEAYDQQTYLTHPWLVTDDKDNAWYVYFADAQPRTVHVAAPAER